MSSVTKMINVEVCAKISWFRKNNGCSVVGGGGGWAAFMTSVDK